MGMQNTVTVDKQGHEAIDRLTATLTQTMAMLVTVANTYDDVEKNFSVPAEYLRDVMWALEDMVARARQDTSILVQTL